MHVAVLEWACPKKIAHDDIGLRLPGRGVTDDLSRGEGRRKVEKEMGKTLRLPGLSRLFNEERRDGAPLPHSPRVLLPTPFPMQKRDP